MGDPWGIIFFFWGGGGGEGLEGANRKKIIGGKYQKSGNSFSTGSGLKTIGNSRKSL